jgi:arylsulfatase A-like enzyme
MLHSGRTLFRAPHDLAGVTLFPEWLREHGYVTFGTGKWHNGPVSYARAFSDGATIFFGGMSDHSRVQVADFDPTGKYPKERRYVGGEFSGELFTDSAIEFLRRHDGRKPFLLYLAHAEPHDPRMAPEPYASMYDPERMPLPPNFLPEHPFDNGELKVRDEQLAPWPRTPEVVREHIAAYYAMITHMDAQVGRLLDALRETGHAEDTIIIFAGDNGLAVGQHGLLGKQSVYEHSVRVPLIISGPGIPSGKRRDAFCYLLDLFPTLCELTGVPVPEGVEGQSLVPVLTGRRRRLRDNLFFAYRHFQRSVRERRYKLIEYFVNEARHTQLFDLATDRWETTNLAADASYAGHLERLRAELARWQDEVDDPLAGAAL